MRALLVGLALLLAGCGGEDIRTYRVPRAERDGGMPPHPEFSRTAELSWTWTAPPGWEPTDPGPVRQAAWRIAEADGNESLATVVALRGDGGGLAATVNRWRLQLGLDAAGGEIPVTTLTTPVGTATCVDIDAGPAGGTGRVLGAILPAGDHTVLVKLAGPRLAVAARQAEFTAFLESIQP